MDDLVFLKPNIQVEPLVNSWYAWSHLVSPATAAFNLTRRHTEMLESYLKAPHLHKAAIKNPAMRGGPFLNLEGGKIEEIRALLDNTRNQGLPLFEFAEAVRELDRMLMGKATGFSMHELYAGVPEILRGYVELVYDLHNRPSYRFFEALLYESPFYIEALQTIALSEITGDQDRSFILSTPRVGDEQTLYLPLNFASEKLDELFKMKRQPKSLGYIEGILGIDDNAQSLFESFFTTEAPAPYESPNADQPRVRFFGHACLLIELAGMSILIDPVISYNYQSEIRRDTYDDLPDEIDFVLITHNHPDHILLETMLQIRHKVKNVILAQNMDGLIQDPSLKLLLDNLGFKNVREIRELEKVQFKGGFIMGIPFIGEHNDLLMHSKLCYHINIGGHKILAMADSCNIEPRLYEKVHRITGDMDILFIGMECDGAPVSLIYGPLFMEKLEHKKDRSRLARGCNYEECLDIVHRFNCKQVYVYAMGMEPWVQYILDLEYNEQSNSILQSNQLVKKCLSEGRIAERLFAEKELVL